MASDKLAKVLLENRKVDKEKRFLEGLLIKFLLGDESKVVSDSAS